MSGHQLTTVDNLNQNLEQAAKSSIHIKPWKSSEAGLITRRTAEYMHNISRVSKSRRAELTAVTSSG